MLFTEGYLNTDFLFVVKKGAPKIEKLEDFKGKVISVNKGSVYDRWGRELEATVGWKIQSYGTQTDAIQAVLSGRAFANVAGNTSVAWAAKKNPGLELSYNYSTGKLFGMPFRKDDVSTVICRRRHRVHEARRHLRDDEREVVRVAPKLGRCRGDRQRGLRSSGLQELREHPACAKLWLTDLVEKAPGGALVSPGANVFEDARNDG